MVVVVTVDSIEIGNSGRVKGNDCCGGERRWSQVVAGGRRWSARVAGLLRDLQIMGDRLS